MKIWKDNYREWVGRSRDGLLRHPCPSEPAPTPEEVFFVRVCSFTFVFYSVAEIGEYLDYYSKKIHPSTATANMNGSHWEFQSKFDELPLYLREEPRRKQVVKALAAAIVQFSR